MVAATPDDSAGPTRRFGSVARIAGVLAVVITLAVAGRLFGGAIPLVLARVRALGPWAPLGFIVLFAGAAAALVPAWLLTIVGGALFGLWPGVPIVLVAATLGAVVSFVIARYIARDAVARRVARSARFRALDDAVASNGLKIVFLLRLSPVVPYNVLNYALGLTRVRFADVVMGSIGMLPATTIYVYCGVLAGDAAALSGRAAVVRGTGYYVVLMLGLVATVAATALVTRVARQALRSAVPTAADACGNAPEPRSGRV